MKPSELRIGNYHEYFVEDKVDERQEYWAVGKIDWQDIKIISDRDERFKNHPPPNPPKEYYRAIPLTEECLLNFGFQRHNEGSVSAQFSYGINPVTKDYLIYLKWIKDHENNYQLKGFPFYQNGHFEIKTVHQLQNLIHALCGEELELKETLSK